LHLFGTISYAWMTSPQQTFCVCGTGHKALETQRSGYWMHVRSTELKWSTKQLNTGKWAFCSTTNVLWTFPSYHGQFNKKLGYHRHIFHTQLYVDVARFYRYSIRIQCSCIPTFSLAKIHVIVPEMSTRTSQYHFLCSYSTHIF